jgi:hypothetical protein
MVERLFALLSRGLDEVAHGPGAPVSPRKPTAGLFVRSAVVRPSRLWFPTAVRSVGSQLS